MDYIPKPPTQQPPPPPTYELKKDVSGKPVIHRGPQVLTNSKGKKFNVPFPPNPNCKKCYGRGYIGYNAKTSIMIPCKKCYPLL